MGGRRMLIVEDDPSSRGAMREIFARRGWDVSTAATAADGLAALEAGPAPDCVVLDLMLPDGDGEDVLRKVRAGGSAARVVVTTGIRDPLRMWMLGMGRPDAVVRKPVDAETVCRACERGGAGA
jgi:two-component system, OmpR family, response regulator